MHSIINLPEMLDISIFIHPMSVPLTLKNLQKKIAQIQAQVSEQEEKSIVRDPMLETAIEDIEDLRDKLIQGQEKIFQIGIYITIYAQTLEDLNKLENVVKSKFRK